MARAAVPQRPIRTRKAARDRRPSAGFWGGGTIFRELTPAVSIEGRQIAELQTGSTDRKHTVLHTGGHNESRGRGFLPRAKIYPRSGAADTLQGTIVRSRSRLGTRRGRISTQGHGRRPYSALVATLLPFGRPCDRRFESLTFHLRHDDDNTSNVLFIF